MVRVRIKVRVRGLLLSYSQSPYPIYNQGKAYLSEQLPWSAAGDPRLSRSTCRSRAWAPAPTEGAAHAFFSTLPSFLLREIFLHLPNHPCESVRVTVLNSLGLTLTAKTKILQRLSLKHAARGVAQSPYPIYSHGKAYLSEQLLWRAAVDPCLARSRSRVWWPPQACCACFFFFFSCTLPSFLFWEFFFSSFPPTLWKCSFLSFCS